MTMIAQAETHKPDLGGGEEMNGQEIKEFQLSLLAFVKRAAEKGATAAEVEALPAVAQVLLNAVRDIC